MMTRVFLCFLLATFGAIASSPAAADETVRAVQARLKAGGFYSGEITGNYDSDTAAAVTRYQIRNGLQINGELDSQTRYALGVSETKPAVPMPRFGEDVWRQLRKSDQAALNKLIAAEDAKKNEKPKKPVAAAVDPPPPAAGPPPPAAPRPPATEYRSERLRDYIAAFVLAGLDPQVGAETEFFADRVEYFGEKGVTREKIRRDLQRYDDRWPQRSFTLAGELDISSANGNLKVTFPLRYQLRNGAKHASGNVLKTLVLEKKGADDFQIIGVNERKL